MKKEVLERVVRERVKKVDSLLFTHQTVEEAIRHMRRAHSIDRLSPYLYVVNDQGELIGSVSTRDLLTAAPDTPLHVIAQTKMKVLQVSHTMKEALFMMQKHRLLALPVTDNGQFIGIIDMQEYFEDKIQLDSSKQKNEIFQTLGVVLEGKEKESTLKKYRERAPWMLCNMIGGIICAIVSHFYEAVLVKAIVLAMFIPLVLSLSEGVSMQAVAQSMYELNKNFLFFRKLGTYLRHEAGFFLITAISFGLIIGCIALFWNRGHLPAMIIGLSIMISILVIAVISVIIPILLHKLQLDPKISSGPIALMISDIVTTIIYLSLATWILL